MDSMSSLQILKTAGLLFIAPACTPHTTEPQYSAHNYVYRKGDPCPHGTENKKNGESLKADGEYRGWYDRSNKTAGAVTVGHGGIPAGSLHRRGYRTYLIQRSGHPLGQGEGGE